MKKTIKKIIDESINKEMDYIREHEQIASILKPLKCYKLYFEDKEGNELMQKTIECRNIKEAKKTADLYFANSMLNDLHKIRTKLI